MHCLYLVQGILVPTIISGHQLHAPCRLTSSHANYMGVKPASLRRTIVCTLGTVYRIVLPSPHEANNLHSLLFYHRLMRTIVGTVYYSAIAS